MCVHVIVHTPWCMCVFVCTHVTLSVSATDFMKSEVLIMTEHNEVILGYKVICEERNFWYFRDSP
jgi:hypothetical protein